MNGKQSYDDVVHQLRTRAFAWVPLDPTERDDDAPLLAAIESLRSSVQGLYDSKITPPAVLDLVVHGCVPECPGGLVTTTKSRHGIVNVADSDDTADVVYAQWSWTVHSFEARRTSAVGAPFPWPVMPVELATTATNYLERMEERCRLVAAACLAAACGTAATATDFDQLWRSGGESYAPSVAFLRCVTPPTVNAAVALGRDEASAWAAGTGPVPEKLAGLSLPSAGPQQQVDRVAAHTDSGFLTAVPVWRTSVGSWCVDGLEVREPTTTEWVPVVNSIPMESSNVAVWLFLMLGEEGAAVTGFQAGVHRVSPQTDASIVNLVRSHINGAACEAQPRITLPFQLRGAGAATSAGLIDRRSQISARVLTW